MHGHSQGDVSSPEANTGNGYPRPLCKNDKIWDALTIRQREAAFRVVHGCRSAMDFEIEHADGNAKRAFANVVDGAARHSDFDLETYGQIIAACFQRRYGMTPAQYEILQRNARRPSNGKYGRIHVRRSR